MYTYIGLVLATVLVSHSSLFARCVFGYVLDDEEDSSNNLGDILGGIFSAIGGLTIIGFGILVCK